MSIIKKIIGLNVKLSRWLKSKYYRFFIRQSYKKLLLERIRKSIALKHIKNVLEAGGIDRPLLTKGAGYIYDGLDIAQNDNCDQIYDHYIVQSIEKPLKQKYDLIISITLLEHVPDNDSSINCIYQSLNPGGDTHHYIPSKWHPYSILLRLVGPFFQKLLIPLLRPGAETVSGYPAYFNHCSASSMKRLFVKHGFKDIEIKTFFAANDYFEFFTPLYVLITIFENVCRKLKLNLFASGFIISGKKCDLD